MLYTFNVDGYGFGSRILEDVMFTCTIDSESRSIVAFESFEDWDTEPYLRGLDQERWITEGHDYVASMLEKIWPRIDSGDFTAEEMFGELNDDGTLEF